MCKDNFSFSHTVVRFPFRYGRVVNRAIRHDRNQQLYNFPFQILLLSSFLNKNPYQVLSQQIMTPDSCSFLLGEKMRENMELDFGRLDYEFGQTDRAFAYPPE